MNHFIILLGTHALAVMFGIVLCLTCIVIIVRWQDKKTRKIVENSGNKQK